LLTACSTASPRKAVVDATLVWPEITEPDAPALKPGLIQRAKLRTGEVAPFDGIHFSPAAVAKIGYDRDVLAARHSHLARTLSLHQKAGSEAHRVAVADWTSQLAVALDERDAARQHRAWLGVAVGVLGAVVAGGVALR